MAHLVVIDQFRRSPMRLDSSESVSPGWLPRSASTGKSAAAQSRSSLVRPRQAGAPSLRLLHYRVQIGLRDELDRPVSQQVKRAVHVTHVEDHERGHEGVDVLDVHTRR